MCGQCLPMLLRIGQEYTWAEHRSALKTVEVNLFFYSASIILEQLRGGCLGLLGEIRS